MNETMYQLTANPMFGIWLTLITFQIGTWLQKKLKTPLCNPLLIAVIICIVLLLKFDIPYENYNQGGQMITFLLGPATVAFAVPLYRQVHILKENIKAVMIGVGAGCIAATVSVFGMSLLFDIPADLYYSFLPKSITTTIGIGIAEELGGYADIAVVGIVVTGTFGATIAFSACKWFKLHDPVAIGLAVGTSSHAGGTARAMEIGEVEGAMGSIAIVVAGVMTVVIAPIIAMLY